MKIGIIGASLAGFTAGNKLARAGHDVTVIVNSRPMGNRLATYYKDKDFFDYGTPFLTAESGEFSLFFNYLSKQKLLG